MDISCEFWNIKKRERKRMKEISISFMAQIKKGESQKDT